MDKASSPTVINDCVHGHIELSRELMQIVNTPQVQRLRDLMQLGLGSYVYPGATHTRFAHSIGVCHLAGNFVHRLQKNQPKLKITDRDIFCVQVAGLCHDLGHGPFSHMFEKAVKAVETGNKVWKHEEASLKLFDMMVEENGLHHLFEEGELNFIKELIHSQEEGRTGRNKEEKDKEFLYEIVSNERTGIDVDKFDYFARDCHSLGIANMFDHNRFIKMARVLRCGDDNKLHICHKDKELEGVIIMFHTRFTLHLRAYKHSVVCALDKMVCDAFVAADEYLLTKGDDGKMYSLTGSKDNMGAYIRLRDSILHRIRDFQLGEDDLDEKKIRIQAAQELVKRIDQRRLYRLVHRIKNFTGNKKEDEIEKRIQELGKGIFDLKDIYVQIPEFGFGMKEKNPLEKLYIYSKQSLDEAVLFNENMVSQLLFPKIFSEKIVRVYCKAEDKEKQYAMAQAAKEWEEEQSTPSC